MKLNYVMFRACLDGMSFKWYHLIFCFHHPNRVGLTDEHLFGWVLDHCFHHSIFWFLSYKNWKHILGVFSFQNLIFNSTFVIKPTYQAAMFDKFFDFFFLFFGETQPQLLKLKTRFELRCQIGGLRNWDILSDDWWKLSDDKLHIKWALSNFNFFGKLKILQLV